MRVTCIQLCSGPSAEQNLFLTKKLILQAIKKKSDFIVTPETSSLFGLSKKELLKKTTTMEKDFYLLEVRKIAKEYKKWILVGSALVKVKNEIKNRSVLINSSGAIQTYYDKIHMYDAKLSKTEYYFESKTFTPGKKIKTANLPWGKLGLSICYDIRFPNMYRKLSKIGSLFITVPSAFTQTTGRKHWHTLLRARAIENFCFIIAPAQCGTHWNKRKTFGHSLIVSPDGKILKELKKGIGFITVDINPNISKILRKRIPSLNKN